jgi:tetratricopeptide (TPR) repeat protein
MQGATAVGTPSDPPFLLGRAEALERRGDWNEAASAYDQMFVRAIADRDLTAVTKALRRAGRVRSTQGRHEEAEELARLSWEIAELNGLEDAMAWAINMVAVIQHAQARLDAAWPLYERALDSARNLRNDRLIGALVQNLGVIANMRGDLTTARSWYLEGVGSAVRSGDQAAAVTAYNNLGMVCSDLREWMEAEVYFSRGIEIAEQLDHAPLLAKLYDNRAEPLLQVGEIAQAERTLNRAEEIATRIQDANVIADVFRFRGVIARRNGDLQAAGQHLSRSLVVAAKAKLRLERAEALEELARVRWQEDNEPEAMATAKEARQVYSALGAEWDARRVEQLMEQWETAQFVADWSMP